MSLAVCPMLIVHSTQKKTGANSWVDEIVLPIYSQYPTLLNHFVWTFQPLKLDLPHGMETSIDGSTYMACTKWESFNICRPVNNQIASMEIPQSVATGSVGFRKLRFFRFHGRFPKKKSLPSFPRVHDLRVYDSQFLRKLLGLSRQ